MLEIRFIMNSPVEDILAFKTCCGLKMFDQNLEIQLINQGRVRWWCPVVSTWRLRRESGGLITSAPGGPAYQTGGNKGLLLLHG